MSSIFVLVCLSSCLKSSFSLCVFKRLLDNSFNILLESSISFDNIIVLNSTTHSIAAKTNATKVCINFQNCLGWKEFSSRASFISVCVGLCLSQILAAFFWAQGSWTIPLKYKHDISSYMLLCSRDHSSCLRHFSWDGILGGCGLHFEVSFQRNTISQNNFPEVLLCKIHFVYKLSEHFKFKEVSTKTCNVNTLVD